MNEPEWNNNLFGVQVFEGLNAFSEIDRILPINYKYDVIIAHETFRSGLAGLLCAEKSGGVFKILDIVEYPLFSERTSLDIRQKGKQSIVTSDLALKYAINIANKYDICFTSSEGQKKIYVDNGAKIEMSVVRNCRQDNFVFQADVRISRDMFNISNTDIVLLYSNRAYADTGIEIAISALKLLDKRFKILLLGEIAPEIEKSVTQLIKTLGLTDRVVITGMIDPSLVIEIAKLADISLNLLEPVIDNHKKSLPNRFFDAITANIPIICFQETEISQLVDAYKLGISIPYRNAKEELLQAIANVIKNYRIFKKFLLRASMLLNWDVEQTKIIDVLSRHSPYASKCLIIANKNIERNDRIRRITKSCISIGLAVDVVAFHIPLPSMTVCGVNYMSLRSKKIKSSL